MESKILFMICVFMWIVSLVCLIYGVVHENTTYIVVHGSNLFTFTLLGAINYDRIKN